MSNNIINCIEKLKFIASVKDEKLRKKLLVTLSDNCLYNALNEIAINTVKGNVKLSKKETKKLKKFKFQIKKLSCKTNDSRKKKKLIIQSGGFLPILIPAVASII